ncbi:MAG: anti-sigma factor family protein [Woeseiaceae bacterium]
MNRSVLPHEMADQLIPWYANETLDAEERQGVSDHLDQCTECRESLALLLHMKEAANAQQTVAIVPEPRPNELLARIEQHEKSLASSRTARPWLIAASLAILAFTATFFIAGRPVPDAEPLFSTATSTEQSGQVGYVVEIGFTSGTSDRARDDMISKLDATLLATLDEDTVDILVPMQSLSLAEIEELKADLLEHDNVISVNVKALRIPVQQDE